ncbi:Hypothetical protein ORPV_1058 [Orpheovirus IHUMI-LCC2]|uniref:Uncharacterized protein n=1 Tax=Orpheovirus IHUMI-LCC2 TaxID=2023057 RepID=A0A2I2L5Y9_9VIRU|nr:Hypothetical protein ORPV_1058 [Orpheovirus IHUMI-LCC2]SNW62962.1 Hypothetical protein ORPV_1058 [Orpheovirus IHUMI-LCC2]
MFRPIRDLLLTNVANLSQLSNNMLLYTQNINSQSLSPMEINEYLQTLNLINSNTLQLSNIIQQISLSQQLTQSQPQQLTQSQPQQFTQSQPQQPKQKSSSTKKKKEGNNQTAKSPGKKRGPKPFPKFPELTGQVRDLVVGVKKIGNESKQIQVVSVNPKSRIVEIGGDGIETLTWKGGKWVNVNGTTDPNVSYHLKLQDEKGQFTYVPEM